MALRSDDYLVIVNSILECIHLNEQLESARLINEKIEELRKVQFESDSMIQKKYILTIGRLKLVEDKIRFKASKVDPLLTETWEILANKMNEQIKHISLQKKKHARLN